ncbi:MAG TPA: TetR/AcrR family transcriptional regulator [Polyangiales bacterium]|nr:TetR/AcrR family transcriptional regulator [Polyangiales bacterium]
MTLRTRPVDPRVARTQRQLHEALLELTLERGWDALSVQQVCERAGVGRSTFYVHFADNEELLLHGFRREHLVPHANGTFGFLRPLVEHVSEHRALYLALLGTRCERAVRNRFMGIVSDLIETDVARLAPASPQRTAAVRYLSGACHETLTWWLEQRTPLPTLEIERSLRQFSSGAIAQLR